MKVSENIIECERCKHRYNLKEKRHVRSGEIKKSINDSKFLTFGCTIRSWDQIQDFQDEGYHIVCACPDNKEEWK
ncbi:MAG: hypothetical protein ACYDAP_00085 [Thermoplasmataceae archaeon]